MRLSLTSILPNGFQMITIVLLNLSHPINLMTEPASGFTVIWGVRMQSRKKEKED